MSDIQPDLDDIVSDLKEGRPSRTVTIRTFLSWFGVQRRTRGNVETIDFVMNSRGLMTIPNYLDIWVDTPIEFKLIHESLGNTPAMLAVGIDGVIDEPGMDDSPPPSIISSIDPSYKIGRIESANQPPVSVKPNASLEEALTIIDLLRKSAHRGAESI